MSVSDVARIIRQYNGFLITCHVSPDGDSLGAMSALNATLVNLGKDTLCFVNDSLPSRFSFLPGYCKIHANYTELDPTRYDALITLDCGSWERTGIKYDPKDFLCINIDHHKDNTFFGKINWVDATAAAVGEMVFALIHDLNCQIDAELAVGIYTALIADTGGFRYANTTSQTHQIASSLMQLDIGASNIVELTLERRTQASLQLLADTLQTARIVDSVGSLLVTQDMLTRTGVSFSELENLVNFVRYVEDVKIAYLITELENGEVKVSLRSEVPYDVSIVARHFGGGGHPQAAGCRLNCSIDRASDLLTAAIKQLLEEVRYGGIPKFM